MVKPSRLLVLIAFIVAICVGAPPAASAATFPPGTPISFVCFRGSGKGYIQPKDKHKLPKHSHGYRCVPVSPRASL